MAFATLSWMSVYPSAGARTTCSVARLLEAPTPVLDHELLPEPVRQPLSHQPRGEIATAAGRKADDKTHRPRRIGFRSRDARCGWQRGSARGPAVSLPGSFFARTITSARDLTGSEGWAITTIGVEAISPTGAKSLFTS